MRRLMLNAGRFSGARISNIGRPPRSPRHISSNNVIDNSKAWERGAIAVKNVDVKDPYLETIRKTHDPTQHVKTIEDELKSTISKSLGKQGSKIHWAVKKMKKEYETYVELTKEAATKLPKNEKKKHENLVRKTALNYNQWRATAQTFRWELMVQRQAAGFLAGNREYVIKSYPIGEPILMPEQVARLQKQKKKARQPTDQLDWWQQFGRWK